MKDILLKYIADNGLKKSFVADEIGVANGTLSQYLNDTYPYPKRLDLLIEAYLRKKNVI
jgi:DNA transposition AAA+ family ATPase